MAFNHPVSIGCRNKANWKSCENGFTLVEIMAVIFIVSIMLAMVAINIGGQSQRKLELESEALARQIVHAIEQAQISRNEFGLSVIDDKNYQFYRFDDQTMDWIADDSSYFDSIELLPSHVIELHQDEEVSLLLYKSDNRDKAMDYGESGKDSPQIVFYSDGTISPFVIELKDSDDNMIQKFVSGDMSGSVIVADEK